MDAPNANRGPRRKVALVAVPLAALVLVVAGGCFSLAKCAAYNELTIRNDTDVDIDVRTEGDTTFGDFVPAHSTRTLKPALFWHHPSAILIAGASFHERCKWDDAKRQDPLVVTADGAGCGEVTLDQPVSPLQ